MIHECRGGSGGRWVTNIYMLVVMYNASTNASKSEG